MHAHAHMHALAKANMIMHIAGHIKIIRIIIFPRIAICRGIANDHPFPFRDEMARNLNIFDCIARECPDGCGKAHRLFHRIGDQRSIGSNLVPLIRAIAEELDDLAGCRNRRVEGWVDIVPHQLSAGLVAKPTFGPHFKDAPRPTAVRQFFGTSVFQQEIAQRFKVFKGLISAGILSPEKIECRTRPFQHLIWTHRLRKANQLSDDCDGQILRKIRNGIELTACA